MHDDAPHSGTPGRAEALRREAADAAPHPPPWRPLWLAATALALPVMPAWAQSMAAPPGAPTQATDSSGYGAAAPAAAATPAPSAAPQAAIGTTAAGTSAAGTSAAGSAPAAQDAAAGQDQAVRVLLDQANYWRGQYQPDRAVTALNRALRLDPDNARALALLAEIQAERGDSNAAQSAYDRLRQAAPGSPSLPAIDQAVRMGPVNQDELSQARELARQGRTAEAVAAYQQVFHGATPPASMAVEYYQTLSGTEGGWEQARQGLGNLVIANPRDLKAQLAYAQVLTYRDQTRAEGIQRLQSLAANPATADAARVALRQALLWLPNAPASAPPIQAYLQADPNDPQLRQKLQTAQNPPQAGPADVVGQMRVSGWTELNRGRLNDAATQFQQALQQDPTDADALGGLGIVRLRQGKTAEGRALLQRAIAADPSKRGNWEAALNGTNVTVQWGEVRSLAARGDSAGAERLLKRLMGRDANAGTYQLLGDLQARNGELDDAEASYRRALSMAPGNGSVMIALAGVLQRAGKQAEADQLFAQAEQSGNRALVGRARADELRARAEQVTDPVAQAGLYRAALAQDPENPWLRLDLARVLAKQGRMAEAQALVQEGIAGARPSSDALQAAVYFYQETNNLPAAAAVIARLPARARTPQMRALEAQIAFQSQVRQAMVGDPYTVRSRLLAMAAAPDPDGTRGAAIAAALNGIGDKQGAREAIITAISASRNPTPAQRIAYAGALMAAGAMGDAYQLASSVDPARLPASEARAAESLRAGIAVRSSDTLNEQGKQAEAYDQLVPVLQQQPANPDANMALARLYESDKRPGRALAISQALLQRHPADLDVRQAAVNAAIADGNFSLAGQWVREGLQMSPNDPRAYMAAADLAKAQGDRGTALRYLETARQLHIQQLSFRDDRGGAAARVPGAEPAAFVTDVPSGSLPLPEPSLPEYASPQPGAPDSAAVAAPPPAILRRSIYQRSSDGPAVDPATDAPPGLALGSTPGTLDQVPADMRARAAGAFRPPAEHAAYRATDPAPGDGASADAAPTFAGQAEVAQAAPLLPPPATGYAQPGYAQATYAQAGGQPAGAGSGYVFQPPSADYNPFRANSGYDNPDMPASLGGTGFGGGFVARPTDALTRQLDTQIAALQNEIAPTASASTGFRYRSGTAGLDELTEALAPMEATFSPGGVGTLKIQATPTYLTAGNIGTNPTSLSLFGAGALYALSPATPSPGTPDATGVGLDGSYSWKWIAADVGSSPLGFPLTHMVGGIELSPELAQDFRLRVTGENRSVTDSVLSYAGMKDPTEHITWGGVERTRGHVQLEYAPGNANFYAGAGYASLTGTHVQSNSEIEGGVGGSYAFYKTPTDEARAGLDLVYFGYDHNERFFTLGGGGYFSPQNYFAAIFPVSYAHTDNRLTWKIGASLGAETYKEASNVYFPIDPDLQAELEGLAANNPKLSYYYPSRSTTGVVGGLNAQIEYKVTPALAVGGRASYQRAGDWNEAQGLVYARYIFNGSS